MLKQKIRYEELVLYRILSEQLILKKHHIKCKNKKKRGECHPLAIKVNIYKYHCCDEENNLNLSEYMTN